MSTEGATVPRGRAGVPSLARVRAALTSRAALETGGVILGFLVMAVVVTWPVLAHAGSIITGGGYGGDQAGYVWDYWYLGSHSLKFWGSGVQEIVGAPFGREYSGSINSTLLTSLIPAWFGAKLGSGIVAYNVVILSGLTFSAASMYLLVRWTGLGVAASIWSGAVFMIFPYEQIRASGHPPLSHLECLPIAVMAGLWWIERPSWRRGAAVAGAVAFAWLTDPYYGLMVGVLLAVFLVVGAIRVLRAQGLRTALARLGEAVGAIVVLVGLPLLALLASSSGAVDATIERNREELGLYGARLTDYVLPPNAGLWHDLLGDFSWSNPGGERMNFMGWSVIALAIIGLVLTWRWRASVPLRVRLLLVAAVPAAFVLIWFSLATPTRWFGAKISMPNSLIFDSFPFLRVYARFVAPVMCLVLAMAAVGLWLLIRDRSITTRLSVLSLVAILAVVDLAPTVPLRTAPPVLIGGTVQADQVPTWQWLRTHEKDQIVFEYPGVPNELVERYFMYGQILHGHRITNGSLAKGQLAYDFQIENAQPTYPGAAQRLASVGIGLVTVEPWGYGLESQAPPNVRRPPPGFLPVRVFADGSAIWRVAAAPDVAIGVRRDGWWAPEFYGGALWRWMENDARITVLPRRPGVFRATFRAHGYVPGAVYTLSFRSPDGFVDKVRIGPERTYSVIVHATSDRSDVAIHDEGPPAHQISAVDERVVSVQTAPWTFTRVGS